MAAATTPSLNSSGTCSCAWAPRCSSPWPVVNGLGPWLSPTVPSASPAIPPSSVTSRAGSVEHSLRDPQDRHERGHGNLTHGRLSVDRRSRSQPAVNALVCRCHRGLARPPILERGIPIMRLDCCVTSSRAPRRSYICLGLGLVLPVSRSQGLGWSPRQPRPAGQSTSRPTKSPRSKTRSMILPLPGLSGESGWNWSMPRAASHFWHYCGSRARPDALARCEAESVDPGNRAACSLLAVR